MPRLEVLGIGDFKVVSVKNAFGAFSCRKVAKIHEQSASIDRHTRGVRRRTRAFELPERKEINKLVELSAVDSAS